MLFRQAPFQEGPRVDAGRGVSLEVDKVPLLVAVTAPEKVVEGHLRERCLRGEAGDVAANAAVVLVGAHHHRHRIPADEALDATLNRTVAGIRQLQFRRNRVHVGRGEPVNAGSAEAHRTVTEFPQQVGCPVRACFVHNLIQGLNPLGGFLWIQVFTCLNFGFQHVASLIYLNGVPGFGCGRQGKLTSFRATPRRNS